MDLRNLTKNISIIFMFSALLFGCCVVEDTPRSKEKDKTTTYKVVFDANGGSGNMPEQIFTAGTSQTLNTNTFKRTGYTFVDWNTEPNGTGVTYVSGNSYSLTGNITLYAQWEKEDNQKITITFDVNGMDETVPTTIEATVGENITLPILANDKFLCWNTKPDGTGTNYSGTVTFNESVILYATLLPENAYKIIYMLDGGMNNTANPYYLIDGETAVLSDPAKDKHTFAGWYTDEACTENQVTQITQSTEINIVLYAKWLANKATITITQNEPEVNLQQVTNGTTVTFTADNSFDKYTWNIDGVKQSETSSTFTIDTSNIKNGTIYKITVIAFRKGQYYSASADLEI